MPQERFQWNRLMEKTNIILIGAGGHAKTVASLIEDNKFIITKVFDKNQSLKNFMGISVSHKFQDLVSEKKAAIIAIGSNLHRKDVSLKSNISYFTLLHSTAIIDKTCLFGKGTVVMQGAILQRDTKIGNHCIINTGAKIDHDCEISDYVHIAPGVTICGNVSIGEGTLIGAGAVILPGTKIGEWAIIGAGTIVNKTVENHQKVVGNPSRVI